jgi:maleylpyruvate isomerase
MTAFADDPMIAHLCEQTDRLLATIHSLDDAAVHAPSALPGWTRGHVLSHLARNADGLANVVRTAITGEVTPMYDSAAARDADIEAGAGRSASEHESDVESSAERLLALIAEVPPSGLEVEVPSGRGPTVRVASVPWVRTREVLYHHVDLATGYSLAHAPDELLRAGLAECPPRLAEAAPGATLTCTFADGSPLELVVGDGSVQVSGPAHAALAWLTGRSDGADLTSRDPLPSLPTWG